ncbi:centriolar coiled-coil protein of 110 kDa isoform X2 [Rhinatrema bivittatum]|uniref:centriolar coiled-coil protein of 110 kDa isoform X2 n=1 Tax=Rhinatrema bivittatum TaxID=194408 RepID=UPI00112B3C60|nr:centriolar coiled-coil protein of 110 kDa isoform X2 [Rhinatrema bivittatum]
MEDYEEFCKKQLVRIQGETMQETLSPASHKSVSVIQFHGVAVLSPLLTLERRKEMQQYRQKAIALDESRLNTKKRTLLTRVQEILETVQVRKMPPVSDLDQVSKASEQNSESKAMNGFTLLPNFISMPVLTEQCRSTKLEKTLECMSSDSDAQFKSIGTNSIKDTNECVSPKQSESPKISHSEKSFHTQTAASLSTTQDMLSPNVDSNTKELDEPLPLAEEVPDPYLMSLQNLLKKSREYIEREHSRRSSSRKTCNGIHSNQQHETFKISDSIKEKAKFMSRSRSCSPVMLDKPSLNKSNILLQGASAQINSMNTTTLSSFSKVDIPMRSGTPTALESESDEELKNVSALDYESSIVKSLTGSYAKLPSPEPSLSPKMHRRRPRPLSMGHIVINNPVNAYELSPKEKERAADLIIQDAADDMTVSESVPKFAMNETGTLSSKGHNVNKNAVEVCDVYILDSLNQSCQYVTNKLENSVVKANPTVESHMASVCKETNTCNVPVKYHEPYATSQFLETQNLLTQNGISSNGLTENVKHCSPVELNKSYDVETPSPILMQNQSVKQQMDTPNVSCSGQQSLESSFENKVKRKLDLDLDNAHKENNPFGVLTIGKTELEKRLQEQRCHPGSAYIKKNEISIHSTMKEILTRKMLALEEMRKRLEEQHAQQLSLLIAEQDREQEKLQKEIEEQERRLKEKKLDASDCPETPAVCGSKGMDLEWMKISEGLANVTNQNSFGSPREPPFYLRGPASSGIPKMAVPKSIGRTRPRWSQVFTPEMQMKFNKVTALAKGFLTRRLMQTDKLKHLRQTIKDTMEFMKMFQSEVPLKRGVVSTQDASLQERVLAQLRAALYEIYDIFFGMEVSERMNILSHDREVRREKMIRQMEKVKSPRERVALSAATQKSLDRKKLLKAVEMGMPNKKLLLKQKMSETRVLQPNQGQNAPLNRLFCRQGSICRKNPKKEAKCCDNLRRQHSLG